jgi:hypothetical protein
LDGVDPDPGFCLTDHLKKLPHSPSLLSKSLRTILSMYFSESDNSDHNKGIAMLDDMEALLVLEYGEVDRS